MSPLWLLVLPITLGAAQILHQVDKRKGKPVVATATPAVALPEVKSVYADESAADRAEREDVHHQRLVEGGWYDPKHPRFGSDTDADGAASRFAQALREIEHADTVAGDDRIALIMLDVRAGMLDGIIDAEIVDEVRPARVLVRANTTIEIPMPAGRASCVIPTAADDLAASFRHVAPHAPRSYRDFDPHVELGLLAKGMTDPVVAAVLAANDPMLGFLLPVPAVGSAPEFAGARDTFEAHSWHTGLTGVMPIIDGEIVGSAA